MLFVVCHVLTLYCPIVLTPDLQTGNSCGAKNFTFCRSYHDVRDTQTRPHVIRYYVQSDFSEKYAKSLPKLEADVEREYISYLRQSCFLEKQQSEMKQLFDINLCTC